MRASQKVDNETNRATIDTIRLVCSMAMSKLYVSAALYEPLQVLRFYPPPADLGGPNFLCLDEVPNPFFRDPKALCNIPYAQILFEIFHSHALSVVLQ